MSTQNPSFTTPENQNETYIVKFDEVLETVDNQLKTMTKNFQAVAENVVDMMSNTTDYHINTLNKYQKRILETTEKTISDYINNNLEAITKSISEQQVVITLPDSNLNINLENGDHKMMKLGLALLATHKKLMLFGEAGTGKSYMANQMASRMNLPAYKISCNGQMTVGTFKGHFNTKTGGYVEPPFIDAYEKGGVLILDEYDAMPAEVAIFFNGIIDGSQEITLHGHPNPDRVKIKRHPNFYVIACGNTLGEGSHEYVAREQQDMALLDRYKLCRLEITFDEKLERALVSTLESDKYTYELFMKLRGDLRKANLSFNTRNLQDLVLNLRMVLNTNLGFTPKTAIEPLLLDVTSADLKKQILKEWA